MLSSTAYCSKPVSENCAKCPSWNVSILPFSHIRTKRMYTNSHISGIRGLSSTFILLSFRCTGACIKNINNADNVYQHTLKQIFCFLVSFIYRFNLHIHIAIQIIVSVPEPPPPHSRPHLPMWVLYIYLSLETPVLERKSSNVGQASHDSLQNPLVGIRFLIVGFHTVICETISSVQSCCTFHYEGLNISMLGWSFEFNARINAILVCCRFLSVRRH